MSIMKDPITLMVQPTIMAVHIKIMITITGDKIIEAYQMDTLKVEAVVTHIIINHTHQNTNLRTIDHHQLSPQLINNRLTHTHSRHRIPLANHIRKSLLSHPPRHRLLTLMASNNNTTHINQNQMEIENQKVFTQNKQTTLLEMVQ